MLLAKPNVDKFAPGESIDQLNQAIASPMFGGNVFLPVADQSGRRVKDNRLRADIAALKVDVINGGGYYIIS